jgi:hypothetical protein
MIVYLISIIVSWIIGLFSIMDSNTIIAIATSVSAFAAVVSLSVLFYAVFVSKRSNRIAKEMLELNKTIHDQKDEAYWSKVAVELAIHSGKEREYYQSLKQIMDVYGAKKVVKMMKISAIDTRYKLDEYGVENAQRHITELESIMHNLEYFTPEQLEEYEKLD